MKAKIIIGASILIITALAAFVISSGATPASQEEMDRIRGTAAYYAGSELMTVENPYGEEELLVNLQDGKIAKIETRAEIKLRVGMLDGQEVG